MYAATQITATANERTFMGASKACADSTTSFDTDWMEEGVRRGVPFGVYPDAALDLSPD